MKLLLSDYQLDTRFLSCAGVVAQICAIDPDDAERPFQMHGPNDEHWHVNEDGEADNPDQNLTRRLIGNVLLTPADVGKRYDARNGKTYQLRSFDESPTLSYPFRLVSDDGDLAYLSEEGRYNLEAENISGFDLMGLAPEPASEPASDLSLTPADVGKLFVSRSGVIFIIDKHEAGRFHIKAIDRETPAFIDHIMGVAPDGRMFPDLTTEADLVAPYDKADAPEIEMLLGMLILGAMAEHGVFDDLPRQ